MKTLRIAFFATVLSLPAFTSGGDTRQSQVEGHRSGVEANLIAPDGTSRTVRLVGVGCTESICSRVFIRTKGEGGEPLRTWLDSVASINDVTMADAVFLLKDGTERRLAFVADFRVLYVSGGNGGTQRIDIAKIRSLEFVDSAK